MRIDRVPHSGVHFTVQVGIEKTSYRTAIGHVGGLKKIAVPPDCSLFSHSVPGGSSSAAAYATACCADEAVSD
jgi:hypothetical protein